MPFNDALRESLQKLLMYKYAPVKIAPIMPGIAESNMVMDKMRRDLAAGRPPEEQTTDPMAATPPAAPTPPPAPAMPAVQPPAAPQAPAPQPIGNTPLESKPAAPVMPYAPPVPAPNPLQSVYGSKYDDNARQQLYDALAQKKQQGAGWEAIGDIADTNANVGGSQPVNAGAGIAKKISDEEKGVKAEFEAGRESKLKDVTTNMTLQKAGREETEYKDANDPNSQMSKLAAGFAGQMLGPEKMSKMGWAPGKSTYADVIKVLPIIEKQVALETAKSNKEIMLGTKTDQFRDKQTQTFRDKLNSSPSYKNWQTMSTLNTQAKQSLEHPSPYNDLQLVYATVKALDPTSVVREGEIKLFQGTANLKNQLQGALSTAIKGQPLTPDQKKNVVTLIGQLEKTNKDVFMKHEEPTLNQARRIGLKLNEIDPMLEDQAPTQAGAAPTGWKVLR